MLRVTAYLMPFIHDPLRQFFVFLHEAPDHEERRLHAEFIEHLQYGFSQIRIRTVVEGQCDHLLLPAYPLDSPALQPCQDHRDTEPQPDGRYGQAHCRDRERCQESDDRESPSGGRSADERSLPAYRPEEFPTAEIHRISRFFRV